MNKGTRQNIIRSIILTAFVAGLLVWLAPGYLPNTFLGTVSSDPAQTKELRNQVLRNPILIGEGLWGRSNLTVEGVFSWTNRRRQAEGLETLARSAELEKAAQMKVDDMFANQYFEHVAPDSSDISDLARRADYSFIIVGENLALGNFRDDQTLVQAWMDSPGHRENILKEGYAELGVAVGSGIFDGQKTWLAVQAFGLPSSACPIPDEDIKTTIARNTDNINAIKAELEKLRREIEADRNNRGPSYQSKVDRYNDLVEEVNAIIESNRSLIEKHNSQIEATNNCIESRT